MKKIFDSKSASQSFFILLIGFVIILISSIYVFTVFLNAHRFTANPNRLTRIVLYNIRYAEASSSEALQKHLQNRHARWLNITLGSKPLPDAQVLYVTYPKVIRIAVHKQTETLKMSVSLSDGRWLNIQMRAPEYTWFSIGFLASSAVLLLALILLCYLTVKRLAIPLSDFSTAAKRFGMDVHAPPLAVAGPEEIQKVVQSFNEMQSRIRRLLHDRTQMLAAVSHDLRTPITRLQLRAEYLKGTSQYEKAIADLKDMEGMISSILAFARDHAQTETMERFDLNVLLDSLCDDMVDMGRDVTFIDNTRRIAYFGRMSSLRRAFTNFIDNAIKYGQKAQVTLNQNADTIQIKISDQGPGIPEDTLEKVFDPFYRVDPARSPQISGTGLGMTVARDIIRAHGGDVVLMNNKPTGLTVLITLPFSEKTE